MASRVASWHHGSSVPVILTPIRRRRSSRPCSVIFGKSVMVPRGGARHGPPHPPTLPPPPGDLGPPRSAFGHCPVRAPPCASPFPPAAWGPRATLRRGGG